MSPRSWLDDERPVSAAVVQAAALLREGCRRPWTLLVTAVGCAALIAAFVFLSKRSFAPRYVLRIVEPDRDPTGMPRPQRQLAEYVRQAVFTSGPLLEILRRHELYPSLAKKNPRAALQSFREDIDVDVYQNYFVEQRSLGAAPRSARLAVSYRNSNPEVATTVTRELGELVVEHELGARRDQALRAEAQAEVDLAATSDALEKRRSEIAQKTDEFARREAERPQRQVELVGLLGSLPALEQRQDVSERHEASLALGAALERHGIGMSFDVVDDGSLAGGSGGRNERIFLGLTSFVFGLPLLAMSIGAFAPRKGVS